MCGIIGYVGKKNAVKEVGEGLLSLEYRGYDSAGISHLLDGQIKTVRAVGFVSNLLEKVKNEKVDADTIGGIDVAIGHTRWATHGGVSEANAHPHRNSNGTISVVHNGIIENYIELRKELEDSGFELYSQTDTEVIPCLIFNYVKSGLTLLEAVKKTMQRLEGSSAILAISIENPGEIIAARRDRQPLNLGLDEHGDAYMSSDMPTARARCKIVYSLESDEYARITHGKIEFYNEKGKITKTPLALGAAPKKAEKGEYSTFMEKEINEIPRVISDIAKEYTKIIATDEFKDFIARLKNCGTLHIAACGTSYHAGLTIAQLLESLCKIRCKVHVASEMYNENVFLEQGDIALVISQSGETADTLMALQIFKKHGLYVAAICNVEGSSIYRYSDYSLPSHAGTEIAVASTKAFIAQAIVGHIIKDVLHGNENLEKQFAPFSKGAAEIIAKADQVKAMAKQYKDIKNIFFLGKGGGAIIALEAALKVKEITYRHCEGFPAGELKHGTLALVDDQTLNIAISSHDHRKNEKIQNAIAEVGARGSQVWVLPIPFDSLLSVIYAQLFALYLAQEIGNNPDKPRNLAKSVTVD
ncbi:MAG: glutamine--fructose-6-phosphate transaminase (isomerizing) [Firmicutes bacterium]|nr:glutamine--fructose-6-phosphate transaminase (isomerizing) [Bacillota bacterium]